MMTIFALTSGYALSVTYNLATLSGVCGKWNSSICTNDMSTTYYVIHHMSTILLHYAVVYIVPRDSQSNTGPPIVARHENTVQAEQDIHNPDNVVPPQSSTVTNPIPKTRRLREHCKNFRNSNLGWIRLYGQRKCELKQRP